MDHNLFFRSNSNRRLSMVLTAFLAVVLFVCSLNIQAMVVLDSGLHLPDNSPAGGGYSASGQIEGVGYSAQIYDSSNGLPTSDANFILCSDDGYVWIGGYSGIIRYDGSSFERMDTSNGLTSGRGMFEDSHGRIWVATNDNGIVLIDGEESIHYTYRDGLVSSSIRSFAEDGKGNVLIGTTSGLVYVDADESLHLFDDDELNEEVIPRLDSDENGVVYGFTKSGKIFSIDGLAIKEIYESM